MDLALFVNLRVQIEKRDRGRIPLRACVEPQGIEAYGAGRSPYVLSETIAFDEAGCIWVELAFWLYLPLAEREVKIVLFLRVCQ